MAISREQVLDFIRGRAAAGQTRMSSTEVAAALQSPSSTVRRHLESSVSRGELDREGQARSTRYRLTLAPNAAEPVARPALRPQPEWSDESIALRSKLDMPLATRNPVSYQRDFVDRYVPNSSSLVPPALAEELFRAGRTPDRQPAGTYARKVLEQLLIDLSWSSSRLEGNRYSLLATEELFRRGSADIAADADAVMLLNHKAAIEFLVDAVPLQGLTTSLIRNLHAVLMQDLLPDSDSLGAIRQKVVNISDTVYLPTQMPAVLEEMLERIVDKARLIKNPIEASFFLWVNLAYLQPFEDGNKRCSRLAANIPLMLYNCSPLSFLDVDAGDYALAMLGVYEFCDVSVAVDLFAWAWRRSQRKYAVVLESLGVPDPMRLKFRESLTDAICMVVRDGIPFMTVLEDLALTEEKAPGFRDLLLEELKRLEVFNCARYRLTMSATQAWIAAGRQKLRLQPPAA